MAEKLEIVLVDSGQSAGQVASDAARSGGAPRLSGQEPSSSARQRTASGAAQDERRAASSGLAPLVESVRRFATSIGGGGLFGAVANLTKGLFSLYDITRATADAMKDRDRRQDGSARAPEMATKRSAAQTAMDRQSSPGRAGGPPGGPAAGPGVPAGAGGKPTSVWSEREITPGMPAGPGGAPAGATAGAPAARAGAPAAAEGAAAAGAVEGAEASAVSGVAAGGELAAVAGPLALVAAAALAAAVGLKKFVDVAHGEAERLKGYSPALAGASAQTELRQVMADMKRANQIGPGLAKVENDRARFNEAVSDLGTQILKALLELYETFRPLIEVGIEMVKDTAAATEATTEGVQAVVHFLSGDNWQEDLKKAAAALGRIGNDAADQQKAMGFRDNPFLNELFAPLQQGAAARRLGGGLVPPVQPGA